MRRNWLEWAVLGLSVAAIAGVTGFLVVDGVTTDVSPPDPVVEVHLDRARHATMGWIVPLTVTNRGQQAAEAVVIEGIAVIAGEEEIRQLEIDFLPSETQVELEMAFSAPPEGGVLVRLVGYRLP
ncbi:MAG: hypothetical protein ACRD02_02640 [Acidimicrobiia bacterium]